MPPTPCSFNKSGVSLVSVKGVAKDKYGSANAKPDLCIARMVFKGVSREIKMELFSIRIIELLTLARNALKVENWDKDKDHRKRLVHDFIRHRNIYSSHLSYLIHFNILIFFTVSNTFHFVVLFNLKRSKKIPLILFSNNGSI